MGEKLTAEANGFLESLLGPGRAKVLVAVEGERSNVQTQTEILTPIAKPETLEVRTLPGYNKELEKKWDYMQKDQEQTFRQSGLIIRRIRVSVVLDSTLSETQASAVRRLLPDVLHLDFNRGDELSVLRADLVPAWKTAIQTPEGFRTILVLAGLLAIVLLVSLLAYITAMRVVRTFVAEIANRRYGPEPITGQAQPSLPGAQAAPLPELLPGGVPSMMGESGALPGAPGTPALGRRFDFLSSREPQELSKLLVDETPDDLALLFAYLADSNPELAATVMQALPAATQSAVSQSLARLNMADPERLAMLENRLKTLAEFGVRGAERLGKILSRLPALDREGIISEIVSSNPDAAREVEKSLFAFEDIARLKPNELRRLIMSVSYPEWGLALRGAPGELVQKVMEQLLPGTQKLLQESMETPQPRHQVQEARSTILSHVYDMAARGEIALNREDASTELI
ncbi:MAG: hypothetical protein HY549_00975 [Elusimicrobia bacterium]|nr:hypothetical protein [Elusimicrobiota bacterium]